MIDKEVGRLTDIKDFLTEKNCRESIFSKKGAT